MKDDFAQKVVKMVWGAKYRGGWNIYPLRGFSVIIRINIDLICIY